MLNRNIGLASAPAAFLILFCFLFAAHVRAEKLRYADEEELKNVPNPQNPQERDRLHCSACRSILDAITDRFATVWHEHRFAASLRRSVKGYHVLAAIDGLCQDLRLHMGLVVQQASPAGGRAYKFAHDKRISFEEAEHFFKGGWITQLWTSQCETVMNQLEDQEVPLFFTIAEIFAADEKKDREMTLALQSKLRSDHCTVCRNLRTLQEELALAEEKKKTNPQKKASTSDRSTNDGTPSSSASSSPAAMPPPTDLKADDL